MGNPDLFIVFNHGEFNTTIKGTDYVTKENAINIVLIRWLRYIESVRKIADKPEELFFDIKSIEIFEIRKEK